MPDTAGVSLVAGAMLWGMMIVVAGSVRIRPEHRAAAIRAALTMAEATTRFDVSAAGPLA